MRQRSAGPRPSQIAVPKQVEAAKQRPRTGEARKLSYKDQWELDGLPGRIDELETSKQQLESTLADPDFYSRDVDAYNAAARNLEETIVAIAAAEARWLELEAVREALTTAADT